MRTVWCPVTLQFWLKFPVILQSNGSILKCGLHFHLFSILKKMEKIIICLWVSSITKKVSHILKWHQQNRAVQEFACINQHENHSCLQVITCINQLEHHSFLQAFSNTHLTLYMIYQPAERQDYKTYLKLSRCGLHANIYK